tara:strand:- start:370 stop:483 length:114 start_codon:yes stop_codon:yes gene_type:complete
MFIRMNFIRSVYPFYPFYPDEVYPEEGLSEKSFCSFS